jgi:putative AlgH/UPF0301 family transcriptional regulator
MRWAVLLILMQVLMQVAFAQQPAVGTLLIASRKSQDPDFKQSVILVVHYGSEGAIGLMLNRPSAPAIFYGGPIAPGTRTLVRSQTQPDKSELVVNGVYMLSGKALAAAKLAPTPVMPAGRSSN